MAWYDEAVFYHIYPLGLTGAPKENKYEQPVSRLNSLIPWISHIKSIGCNALYIGPLFESVGHGYETTDYKKLDSRLGTNEDLTNFVKECHEQGIRVILDGVFNHTGRDFFAFQDIKKNRENSPYRDWYCNVNFGGNNEYNDGFSYENWGGYNLLVKLNQHNQAVKDYICDVIRFWVREFDIDGIRLDAADVLDFGYMQALRSVANEVKPEFWLMGEVIHGDYNRWVNEGTLHSVTNYQLHKALYSGHNDHNYFEIAHTVKRLYAMGGNRPDGLKLYNFVDNHDVERIYTKLQNKAHFTPVHILMYTLPGVPSIYYGSEFGIEGRKEKFSDDSLRPQLNLEDYKNALSDNSCTKLIAALGRMRICSKALSYGDYNEILLMNRQYAFSRTCDNEVALVAVNNDDSAYEFCLPANGAQTFVGVLSGQKYKAENGNIRVLISANCGDVFVPETVAEKIEKFSGDKPIPVITPIAKKEDTPGENRNSSGEAKEAKQENKNSSAEAKDAKRVNKKESAEAKDDKKENKPASSPAKELEQDNNVSITMNPKEKETAQVETEDIMVKDIPALIASKSYEDMTVEELQQVVLWKLSQNGPLTDQMKQDVAQNVYHNSLVNWAKSFR